MRLDNCEAHGITFIDEVLAQLRAYQNKNDGNLPPSFSRSKLQKMYLKMKAANQVEDKPSSELMLFLLNQAGLHNEVIDFCK